MSQVSAAAPTGLRRRWLVRLPAAVGLGLLLALAFPPYGAWWLAVPAVAAATLLVRGLPGGPAAVVGLAFGTAFFALLLRWLLVIGPDAWLLLSVVQGGYVAGLFAGLAVVQRLPGWPVWTAALWVAAEAVRATVPFGGFPWGRLAFAQADAPFGPLVALGGTPLVTFAVALAAGALAWGARAAAARRPVPALAALAAVAAPALVGLLVPLPTQGRAAVAAVVQGDVPRAGLDAFGQRAAVLRNHVDATLALADDVAAGGVPQPELVVWPENATDIDPYASASAAALIQDAVDAIAAPTLVGAVVTNPDDPSTVLNLGIVWAPGTGPGESYAKRHPVPFGEYLPFRDLLSRFVTRFERIPRDFAAGDEPGVLALGPARAGVVICFEVAYDGVVRDTVRGGGDLLVVQTNNATYGRTGQPEQQLAMSRLRAMEHGRTVLVAATSGLSAVITPDGEVVAGSAEFEQWTAVRPVVLRTALSPASRVGPWPEAVLATLGVAACAVATLRRRQERSPAAP